MRLEWARRDTSTRGVRVDGIMSEMRGADSLDACAACNCPGFGQRPPAKRPDIRWLRVGVASAFTLVALLFASALWAAETITVLGVDVPPGQTRRVGLNLGQSFLGNSFLTPVIVMNGLEEGPTLCLTATVHGNEINGAEVIHRLSTTLDPAKLKGRLLAIPVVNLPGFLQFERNLPSGQDPNRYYPGHPERDPASRLAHTLLEKIVDPHCTHLVDLHTAASRRVNFPHLRVNPDEPRDIEFATLFGSMPVLWEDGSRRMLRRAAGALGRPAVSIEFGSADTIQPAMVSAVTLTLTGLMQGLQMTEGPPPSTTTQITYPDSQWLRADAGGLFINAKVAGDEVRKGETLGVIVNLFDGREKEIIAPETGRLLGVAESQFVLPGYGIYHLGLRFGRDR
jgi:predicted deacylase